MSDQPFLESVRRQYEDFPYPPRDPEQEKTRLLSPISGNLLLINHHCFQGRRKFRSGFRCLTAGAGTGDVPVYLAEQLRNTDAEIVYLDMSEGSRQVAEARARIRKLTNITWITASILEIPKLRLGKFDYIESAGVLHHLESTEDGLAALAGALRDDGGMYLMLYARYGRRSIYEMQSLLRRYLPAGLDSHQKVAAARKLLDALPESNSFRRESRMWSHEIGAQGHSDAGLYDLLLHSQDRSFDVPEVYQLARSGGLQVLGFAHRADAYDPLTFVADEAVRERLQAMPLPDRQAVAELMIANISKHEFFLGRRPDMTARLEDEDNALRSFDTMFENAPKIAADMVPGRIITYGDPGQSVRIISTPIAKVIYSNMDGRTSIRNLRRKIRKAVPDATDDAITSELHLIWNSLHPRGYLYLIREGDYGVQVPDYSKVR